MNISIKQINQKSLALGKRGKSWAQDVHKHAMTIAAHIAEHGDVTIADTLCNVMPKGTSANSLRSWFEMYGGCSYNNEKKAFGKRKDFTFDPEAANAEPWFDLHKETEYKSIDSEKLLQGILGRMKSALADDERRGKVTDKINPDHIAAIEAILSGDIRFEDTPVEETPAVAA